MSIFLLSACTFEATIKKTSSGNSGDSRGGDDSSDGTDTTAPDVSLASFDDGTSEWSKSQTATMSWSGFTDTGSGISHYELALGTSPGATDVQTWTTVGSVTSHQITGLSLNRGQAYYASLRAQDLAGNTSAAVNGNGWFVKNEMWVPNGPVNALVESGNTLYMGGSFSEITEWSGGGVPVDTTTGLVNWPDNTSKARVSGEVLASVSDGNGGFYIGGVFNAVGGILRNNLAHILADGSLGSWNPNANNGVFTLAISGTTLFVGGSFTTMNGSTTRNRLASFNTSDGSLTSWDPNAIGSAAVGVVTVSGSTVYVGGGFTGIGGGSSYFAPLDITTGRWLPGD